MKYADFITDVRMRFGAENNAGLERFLGLSNGYLSKFESGLIKDPNKLLFALALKGFKFEYKIAEGSPVFISIPPDNLDDKAPKEAYKDNLLHDKAPKEAPKVRFYVSKKDPPGIPLVYEGAEGLEDGIVIPLLENAASAGYGSGVDDNDTPVRYIQVPHHLSKYPHLAGLPVKGDSMEPTLHDGDLVVCDGGGWDGDGIYVLKTHDTSYVKRVQMTSQGYEVISDNKMYKSITESAESLSIVGKVRAILVIVPGRRGGV
ncbi:MAG: S24 family peptidase [Treponema sp.]|nr:S24 family peptidase [Treponema sp.]